MPVHSPIQTSFAGGEISPRARGRVDTELYRRALALCRNWQPTPQGSLRMRAGTEYLAENATPPRLITFNVTGGDPYILELTDSVLRIRSWAGVRQTFPPAAADKITNGRFDATATGWTLAGCEWKVGGYVGPTEAVRIEPTAQMSARQNVALVEGRTYRLRFRGWYSVAQYVTFRIDQQGGGTLLTQDFVVQAAPAQYELDIVATAAMAAATVVFTSKNNGLGIYSKFNLDEVSLIEQGVAAVDEFATSWTAARIPAVQYDQELTKSRMMLVHGNAAPKLLTLDSAGIWRFEDAPFEDPPSTWSGTNYPSAIEWGFQGRLWLAGEPIDPNVFRGSASGQPFKFTAGGANPGDAVSYSASVRGALRWLRGQKVLLLGAERVEQSASGGSTVIAPGNVDVRDESAFGSAAIQAAHIGDQALWVTRDRRHIRAMDYDLQKDGWVSRALTFIAEHLTVGGIVEVAFAGSPEPTILARRSDGVLIACTYDRAEQVLAFYRVNLSGDAPVNGLCVGDTDDGCELVISATRDGGEYLERLPLHEVGVGYLDSAVTVQVVGNQLAGLGHLEGEEVTLVSGGARVGSGVVAGGAIAYEAADGTSVTVGLAYRATAQTLPREVKTGKARDAKIGVLVSNSALPLLNGRRPPDRTPATPQDQVEPLATRRVHVSNLGWSDDGVVTIEQDLPVRTEVLALFAVTAQERV